MPNCSPASEAEHAAPPEDGSSLRKMGSCNARACAEAVRRVIAPFFASSWPQPPESTMLEFGRSIGNRTLQRTQATSARQRASGTAACYDKKKWGGRARPSLPKARSSYHRTRLRRRAPSSKGSSAPTPSGCFPATSTSLFWFPQGEAEEGEEETILPRSLFLSVFLSKCA